MFTRVDVSSKFEKRSVIFYSGGKAKQIRTTKRQNFAIQIATNWDTDPLTVNICCYRNEKNPFRSNEMGLSV